MMNLQDFVNIKIFLVEFVVNGIINVNDKFLIIGVNLFCMFNFDFEVINEIDVDDNLDDIIFDVFGNIIYLCYMKDIVIKKDNENEIMFVYRYLDLKVLYGFVVDLVGNIYVCGYFSNNIYVILEVGKILRILFGFICFQFIVF